MRLVLITQDQNIRDLQSASGARLRDLEGEFSEISVILLNLHDNKKNVTTERLGKNIWIYHITTSRWWNCVPEALDIAEGQLVFNGAFRGDRIIADDTFESCFIGLRLYKKYHVPLQLHYAQQKNKHAQGHSWFHKWVQYFYTKYVMAHQIGVWALSEQDRQDFESRHNTKGIQSGILPRYYDLVAWRDAVPTFSLAAQYPELHFFILHVSTMTQSAHTETLIKSVAPLLRMYPTIGLIILGSGPLRTLYEGEARACNVARQVEFVTDTDMLIGYMKQSQVLVHLSTSSDEEGVLLAAAAVKLPIITLPQGIAQSLFVDTESVLFCTVEAPETIGSAVSQLLNENQTRIRLALAANDAVFERVAQDYNLYRKAYADIIRNAPAT